MLSEAISAGHQVPARLQLGLNQARRSILSPVPGAERLDVVGGDDGVDMAGGRAGGRRIAPVEDHLQRRLAGRPPAGLEIRRDAEHQQRLAAVDLPGDLPTLSSVASR
jgi:hypothetical protein